MPLANAPQSNQTEMNNAGNEGSTQNSQQTQVNTNTTTSTTPQKDNQQSTFSYWTVVPGANVGKVPIPAPFVESTQGSERYRTVCHADGDLKQGAKDFSLCMKHQQGTCRMGERCHQLHVNPEFFHATKFWNEVRRTCCTKHDDFNSRSEDFLTALRSHKYELAGVPGPNNTMAYPVECTLLARTAGLLDLIKSRPANETRPVQFSVRQICRLHLNDECRFGRDCGRIHVCRDFVNRELPLPPVPRKKNITKENTHPVMMPVQGYQVPESSTSITSQHANLNTNIAPWMRGNGGMNAPHNHHQLGGMAQASTGHQPGYPQRSGQFSGVSHHPVGAGLAAGNAGGRMSALLPGSEQHLKYMNPNTANIHGNAAAFPSGVFVSPQQQPGTPLSTPATPGSMPGVVRSVVDMTLQNPNENELELRRRQALLATNMLEFTAQALALLQQGSMMPANAPHAQPQIQPQHAMATFPAQHPVMPQPVMQHNSIQALRGNVHANIENAGPTRAPLRHNNNKVNVNNNANSTNTGNLLHQALRETYNKANDNAAVTTGGTTTFTNTATNMTTAPPASSQPHARPTLGDLTNTNGNVNTIGNKIGGARANSNDSGNGDYSMFAGGLVFPNAMLPTGLSPFSPLVRK